MTSPFSSIIEAILLINKGESMADFLREKTLLVADDEPLFLESVSEALGAFCKRVMTAGNGKEAWEKYRQGMPEILLLDVTMPGMSGLDLVEKIRKEDHATRIVLMTAHTDEHFLLKAAELELTRYLVKPVTMPQLLDALEKCVAQLAEGVGACPAPAPASRPETADLGRGFRFREEDGQLFKEGRPVDLTKSQRAILALLLEHRGKLVEYEAFQSGVWEEGGMTPSAIRSMIRDLRKVLYPELIGNVAGLGYKLELSD